MKKIPRYNSLINCVDLKTNSFAVTHYFKFVPAALYLDTIFAQENLQSTVEHLRQYL